MPRSGHAKGVVGTKNFWSPTLELIFAGFELINAAINVISNPTAPPRLFRNRCGSPCVFLTSTYASLTQEARQFCNATAARTSIISLLRDSGRRSLVPRYAFEMEKPTASNVRPSRSPTVRNDNDDGSSSGAEMDDGNLPHASGPVSILAQVEPGNSELSDRVRRRQAEDQSLLYPNNSDSIPFRFGVQSPVHNIPPPPSFRAVPLYSVRLDSGRRYFYEVADGPQRDLQQVRRTHGHGGAQLHGFLVIDGVEDRIIPHSPSRNPVRPPPASSEHVGNTPLSSRTDTARQGGNESIVNYGAQPTGNESSVPIRQSVHSDRDIRSREAMSIHTRQRLDQSLEARQSARGSRPCPQNIPGSRNPFLRFAGAHVPEPLDRGNRPASHPLHSTHAPNERPLRFAEFARGTHVPMRGNRSADARRSHVTPSNSSNALEELQVGSELEVENDRNGNRSMPLMFRTTAGAERNVLQHGSAFSAGSRLFSSSIGGNVPNRQSREWSGSRGGGDRARVPSAIHPPSSREELDIAMAVSRGLSRERREQEEMEMHQIHETTTSSQMPHRHASEIGESLRPSRMSQYTRQAMRTPFWYQRRVPASEGLQRDNESPMVAQELDNHSSPYGTQFPQRSELRNEPLALNEGTWFGSHGNSHGNNDDIPLNPGFAPDLDSLISTRAEFHAMTDVRWGALHQRTEAQQRLTKLESQTFRGGAQDAEIVCAICLSNFEVNAEISKLQCSHQFHTSCVKQWFSRGRNTCPTCRNTGS